MVEQYEKPSVVSWGPEELLGGGERPAGKVHSNPTPPQPPERLKLKLLSYKILRI